MLTQERLEELVSYDPKTGGFVSLVSRGRVKAGSVLGVPCNGYTRIHVDGKDYYAHRLAWLYVHGVLPDGLIDHINGDKADNRIANLRVVTHLENARNAARKSGTRSRFRGVSWSHGKWVAAITVGGKFSLLGKTDREEHAALLYDMASLEIHGEYGRRNFYPLM